MKTCPDCDAELADDATCCPVCGASAEVPVSDDAEFIFCEGCGARLMPSDRVCPKCGRPAPGILSTQSASSDLAAGKTASFPRLTPGMLAEDAEVRSVPQIVSSSLDPEATNILDASALREDAQGERKAASAEKPEKDKGQRKEKPVEDDGRDPYAKPRRGRYVVAAAVAVALVGGAWFVAADPAGVMPGFYSEVQRAAGEMFPSRDHGQAAEGSAEPEAAQPQAEDDSKEDDKVLSDAEAYQKLTAVYDRIRAFQDELAPVIEDYNAWYIADDRSAREQASTSAYALRDSVQKTIDELDGLQLEEGSAYGEDVDHLKQLAGWMYNRVDVLCRSWDLSLAYAEGEHPSEHRAEIVAPLNEPLDAQGVNQDVTQYERYIGAWKPQER